MKALGGYEAESIKEARMPQAAQLEFYLDLRRRILGHEFAPGERLTGAMFSQSGELTHSATMGVLNALATDGYLNKHKKSYTRAIWTAENLIECVERLEVFVEICSVRVIQAHDPRLVTLHQLGKLIADTDPADEGFLLRTKEWLTLLFDAGDRRTIGQVAYKLIPQAFYRVLWNLMICDTRLRKICKNVARSNVDLLEGDIRGTQKRQAEVYAGIRRAIDLALRLRPAARLDIEFLYGRNEVREADVRGRLLALSHPVYPLHLPVDRPLGTSRALAVQWDIGIKGMPAS